MYTFYASQAKSQLTSSQTLTSFNIDYSGIFAETTSLPSLILLVDTDISIPDNLWKSPGYQRDIIIN